MAVAFHQLEIADVRRDTEDAVSLAFAVPPQLAAEYRFTPGQHLTLRTFLAGVEMRRSYSICSGLDDGELRVAVKRHGVFSEFINTSVKQGGRIDVMTPQGRFGIVPDPGAARDYLFIAAGSGITPVMSILKSVLAREPASRAVLLYGNRTARSIILKRELEDLKDRHLDHLAVYHVLSRERQEVELLNGRIDPHKIRRLLRGVLPAANIDHAFLCGPGDMIETARSALAEMGGAPERIHIEHFTVEGAPAPSPGARAVREEISSTPPVAVVDIRLNGLDHVVPLFEGETIVAAGLRHGLEMPYSCRGGMCCTCRARLVSGQVKMDRNYSLEPWELEKGFVLTCQSHPVTARVAVDYDEL
jgi:ring-1,2-phenylacetyl-CoA epoxidase subunit PaaE